MGQPYSSANQFPAESQKPLYYSVWSVVDRKGTVLSLLAIVLVAGFIVWRQTGGVFFGVLAVLALLSTMWICFVPIHFEINSEGIVRGIFGRKRFISWDDIRIYQVRSNGILLLPQKDRFLLEAFRGFFLPVPPSLSTEVLYRFRVFVDRVGD